MRGVNKVMILGRLGQDPKPFDLSSGGIGCNFSVATSESWLDKSSQKVEKTEWHNIVVFSKLAEIVKSYVKKGTMVYVEGKLSTRKWQDKNGGDRYSTEIIANSIEILSPKSETKSDGGFDEQAYADRQVAHAAKQATNPKNVDTSGALPFDDEVPF